jgi:hypothetical protein
MLYFKFKITTEIRLFTLSSAKQKILDKKTLGKAFLCRVFYF